MSRNVIDAADQRSAAVVQPLAVDVQYRVGLTWCPVHCNLAGKLVASASFDQWQLFMVDLRFAICSEIAKCLVPLSAGFLSGTEPEYRTCGRIDVEHVTVTVDDDYAIVNALQN